MPKFIEAFGADEPVLETAAFFVRDGDGLLVDDPETHKRLAWVSRADAEAFAAELTEYTGKKCHAVPPEPHELAKAKRLQGAPSAAAVAAHAALAPPPPEPRVPPSAATVAGIHEVAPLLQPVTGPVTEAAAKARTRGSRAAAEKPTPAAKPAKAKATAPATETEPTE